MAEEEKNLVEEQEENVVEIDDDSEDDSQEESQEESQEQQAGDSRSEEELKDHTSSVQKRINELTKKWREAERAQKSALEYARSLQDQNKKLQEQYSSLDDGYQKEFETRINTQVNDVKASYKAAYESGDIDKMAEAQELLAQLSIEKERLRIAKQNAEVQKKQREAYASNQVQQQQIYAANQQAVAKPDRKALEWAEKNQWFGTDRVMTRAAQAIHEDLLDEGFDPTSDEYYSEIDSRVKSNFPQKFTDVKEAPKTAQTVASATRITKTGRLKQIKLTPSEVEMAKKLNVPLKEYARFVKR